MLSLRGESSAVVLQITKEKEMFFVPFSSAVSLMEASFPR